MSSYVAREDVARMALSMFSITQLEWVHVLRGLPTIEIIHCHECSKHNTHRCHMAFDLIATEDDDFCSYGERSNG